MKINRSVFLESYVCVHSLFEQNCIINGPLSSGFPKTSLLSYRDYLDKIFSCKFGYDTLQ